MKIIPASSSDPIPVAPVPSTPVMAWVPPPQAEPEKEPVREDISQVLLGPLQALEEKFENVRVRLTEQLLQNTRQVAKLSEEVAALRDALADVKPPPKQEPSQPVPETRLPADVKASPEQPLILPPMKVPRASAEPAVAAGEASREAVVLPKESAPRSGLPDTILDSFSASEERVGNNENKVALLAKLWDYLNQVAFEIPLHKSKRSN